jgi:hypothetical protein
MNEINQINPIVSSLFSPAVVSTLPLSNRTKAAIRRDGGEIIKDAVLSMMYEQARATLTNTALQNVGALSALEDHLRNVSPSGAGRYKALVDAYALGAMRRIARW